MCPPRNDNKRGDKEAALSAPKGATPKGQIPKAHGHGVPRAE